MTRSLLSVFAVGPTLYLAACLFLSTPAQALERMSATGTQLVNVVPQSDPDHVLSPEPLLINPDDTRTNEERLKAVQDAANEFQDALEMSALLTKQLLADNEALRKQAIQNFKRLTALEQQVTPKKSRAKPLRTKPSAMAVILSDVLQPHIHHGHVELESRDTYTLIRLTSAYFFPSLSDKLSSDGMSTIEEIGHVLAKHPTYTVAVIGHTDNRPLTDPAVKVHHDHLSLSSAMAYQVAQGLIVGGVTRLNTEGLGTTQPLTSNATEEGRAKNRRVEIHIAK